MDIIRITSIVISALMSLCGCSDAVSLPNTDSADVIIENYSGEPLTFDETISKSNYVVLAKAETIEVKDSYAEYTFACSETLKGGTKLDTIQVRFDLTDDFAPEKLFETGKEYILPLVCVNSVYFDSPVYSVTEHLVISVSADKSISSSAEIPSAIKTTDALKEYIGKLADKSETLIKDFVTSADIKEIADGSDYIVRANVDELFLKSGEDRGIYLCTALDTVKGNIADSFKAVFLYDSVEVGKVYYLFLTKTEEGSSFYIVSSKNSIYAEDNAEAKALFDASKAN